MKPILALLMLVVMPGCVTGDKQIAENSVHRFHALFNSGAYSEIYKQSDESFRKSVSQSNFLKLLGDVNKELGRVEEKNLDGDWRVRWNHGLGTTVSMNIKVKFTKGKATEDFIWHVKGGSAKLAYYSIKSELGTLPKSRR